MINDSLRIISYCLRNSFPAQATAYHIPVYLHEQMAWPAVMQMPLEIILYNSSLSDYISCCCYIFILQNSTNPKH